MPNPWERIKKTLEERGYHQIPQVVKGVTAFENEEGVVITVGLGVVVGRKIVEGKVAKSDEHTIAVGADAVNQVIIEMSEVQNG